MAKKYPCPLCGRSRGGLDCPEPECRERVAKLRAEPADGGRGGGGSSLIPAREHTAGGGDRIIRSTRGLS